MNYKVIRGFSNKILYENGFLPEILLEDNTLFIFGVENAESKDNIENLVGIIVFKSDKRSFSTMNLVHAFVRDIFRGQGLAKKMFEYAVSQLNTISVKAITFDAAVEKTESEKHHKVLQNFGFEQIDENGTVLICRQGSFQGETLEKIYDMAAKQEKKIVMINNYYDKRLVRYFEKHKGTRFYLRAGEYDPRYSRFYEENGEIKAAVCARKLKNGDVYIDGCYVNDDIDQPYIVPYMISVLGHNNKSDIDESKNMIINVYYKKMLQALLEFINRDGNKEVEEKDLIRYSYEIK